MIRPALALAATAAALALPAQTYAANVEIDASGPVIELDIYEAVTVAPDMATIGAGVTSEAPTAVEALRMNSAEMQKVIDRIKALGIAEKDIQTTGINLNARYDYDREGQRQIFRGYQVSNRVSVKLRKIEDTGKVLDALVAAGATDLSGPNFSIENDDAAKDAARKRALERATDRATAYAAMLGYDGARVLSVRESISGSGPMPESAMLRMSADMPSAAPPPVQPGMVSTGISISITYELVNKDTPEAG
ncbi:SIMPL domain-containing protein [Erythrobacter sp. sf7]|uniref:SIMPL domain-containing protein n=2 Tax=Erythrobacter fulvus TaxID=2987523 RepID=A0ABT5JN63_9SPHN|nr:SIMPL domain-containing protein [Erythrobacter fulvus]